MEQISGYTSIQGLIQQRYTEESYQSEKKIYPLHHWIALNRSYGKITNALNKLDKTAVEKIMKGDLKLHGLTPLHLSLFAPFEIFVLILDKTPVSIINAKDEYGWTALHHTTLLPDFKKYEEALLEKKADPNEKTYAGGTLLDLKRLVGRVSYAPSKKMTTIEIEGQDKHLEEITEQQLCSLTGLKKYTDCCVYSEKYFINLWKQEEQGKRGQSLVTQMNQAYQNWQKKPPFLQIKKRENQYGLVAGSDILPGKCLGPYTGLYKKEQELEDVSYFFDSIDAKKYGNIARFANHGFPNSAVSYATINGRKQNILIAIEKIAKEEEVTFDYGLHFKGILNDFILLKKEKLSSFFKNGLNPHIQTINQIKNKETLEYFSLVERIIYSLNTPKALLYLHFIGLVPADEHLRLVENAFSIEEPKNNLDRLLVDWYKTYGFQKFIVYSFLKRIVEWEKGVENDFVKEKTGEWILNNIDTLSTVTLLHALKLILETEQKNSSKEAWKKFFFSLYENVKNYSYTNDEESFLSPDRIIQDLNQIYSPDLVKQTFQNIEIPESEKKHKEFTDLLIKIVDRVNKSNQTCSII